MEIRTLNVETDRETLISFFKATYRDATGTEIPNFEEDRFIEHLGNKAQQFPEGYVLLLKDGQAIGHMQLQVKSYEEKSVGYVSIIYLHPDYRGQGISQEMLAYAERFFQKQEMSEYHLRVDVENKRALRFYEKAGMIKRATEPNSMGDLCYRLEKRL